MRSAAANSASTASRSASARRPASPPRSAAASSRCGQPDPPREAVPDHTDHSTASALPCAATTARASCSRRARRRTAVSACRARASRPDDAVEIGSSALRVGGQQLDELADQGGRRRGPALGIVLALDAAQRAAEPAQVGGVGVGERREQQLARGLVVERVRVDDDAEQREQRRDRRPPRAAAARRRPPRPARRRR